MSYEDLSDDTKFATDRKPEPSAIAVRDNITRVEGVLSEFDAVTAGLADLEKRFPKDLVYEVTTTRGMAEAIAHRAAWREPRITVEKLRKTAKAPVLALGKDIDARAAWLTSQLEEGEKPVDDQIQAELSRKERVRLERINAEAGRVMAIQEAIAEIGMAAMVAASKPAAEVEKALNVMRAFAIEPTVFQELVVQADAAKHAAIGRLETLLKAKLHDEAEAAKVAAERAELAELRKSAAEQKAKDDAAAAQKDRLEREAKQAEQARLDAESAAKRAEADRIASEARVKAQAEHEAKMKAEREAAAETRRAAEAKALKELAKRAKAEAAEKQLRDAAPDLLAALRAVLADCQDVDTDSCVSLAVGEQMLAAIEKATG